MAYNSLWICLIVLIWSSSFHQRPASRLSCPFRFFQNVLGHLASSNFSSATLAEEGQKDLIPGGLWFRVSQVYTLGNQMAWTVFAPDAFQASLSPSAMIRANSERKGHCLNPFVTPTWVWDDQLHTLCSLSALHQHMDTSLQASHDCKFVWPTSLASCTKKHIAQVVCKDINSVDPRRYPALWDVHRVGSFPLICLLLLRGSYSVLGTSVTSLSY